MSADKQIAGDVHGCHNAVIKHKCKPHPFTSTIFMCRTVYFQFCKYKSWAWELAQGWIISCRPNHMLLRLIRLELSLLNAHSGWRCVSCVYSPSISQNCQINCWTAKQRQKYWNFNSIFGGKKNLWRWPVCQPPLWSYRCDPHPTALSCIVDSSPIEVHTPDCRPTVFRAH